MSIRQFANKHPVLDDGVFIDEMALVLGDVELGVDCSVWPMAVIRGDIHQIRIGKRTNIQDGCILHVTHDSEFVPGGFPLHIGDDVTVGHNVTLHACTIGHRCLIGMGSTVLDGAVLEDEVMIGANALVTPGKKLEAGFLYVGSPVKKVRKLTGKELNFLRYSAQNYVDLKNQHLI